MKKALNSISVCCFITYVIQKQNTKYFTKRIVIFALIESFEYFLMIFHKAYFLYIHWEYNNPNLDIGIRLD